MLIVFHGANAQSFLNGFDGLVQGEATIAALPDQLATQADRDRYAAADIVIGNGFNASLPMPAALKLFHVPGAGYDAVDLAALPASAAVCNCFGHEQAIAEYVMGAILARTIPLAAADRDLRNGQWTYWAGAPERIHGEIAGKTIGLVGFGHIGKTIARRAKAFEMQVHVANRSAVAASELVDRAFPLDDLATLCGDVDFLVTSLPLDADTRGLIGAVAIGAMRSDAVLINVGRGPVVDEQALFDALSARRIGGAVIDTWYVYPSAQVPGPQPSRLPFNTLDNVVMTPHMSGWTEGTIRRRQQTMADNINRLRAGRTLLNLVRAAAM